MGNRITIATSVFNGAARLQRCIDSVASQSYADVEHVIIDGGSTDGTLDILRANEAKLAYWISERDDGIYDAWNKAIAHSGGDWIVFVGCDDFLWHADSLARMAPHLASAYPEHSLVYGVTVQVDPGGNAVCRIGKPWPSETRLDKWVMDLPNPSLFYHRSLFDKYGPFDKAFRSAGDFEFLLRVLQDNEPLFAGDINVTGFEIGGVSNDIATALRSLDEVRAARFRHGISSPMSATMCLQYAKLYAKLAIQKSLGRGAMAGCLKLWRSCKHRGQRAALRASEAERTG